MQNKIKFLILVFLVLNCTSCGKKSEFSNFELKKEASTLALKAFDLIKEERLNRNIEIDSLDKNQTGLIGIQESDITTVKVNIMEKRTTTNPNFAALFVAYFTFLGLKEKDHIAINLTSSFPALSISLLAACEVMKLNAHIILSLAASTYGANIVNFSALEMDEILYKKNIFSNKAEYVSMGGGGDIGREFPSSAKDYLYSLINNYQRYIIYQPNYTPNVAFRYSAYQKMANQNSIKLFIHLGGSSYGLGLGSFADQGIPQGLIMPSFFKTSLSDSSGLIEYFLSNNIPSIAIYNLLKLCEITSFPYDPNNVREIGTEAIFSEQYKLFVQR